MKSDDKTKEQPVEETDLLKAKIAELEKSETDRERAEEALRSLNAAALAVQRVLKPEDVFRVVASELRRFGVHTTILLLDEDKKNLMVAHISFSPKLIKAAEKLARLKASNARFPLDRIPQHIKEVLRNRVTVFNQGSEQIEGFLPAHLKGLTNKIAKIMGLQKGIVAPLVVEGKVIGTLSVDSPELTEKDMPAITAFANQVSIAVEKARLYEAAKQELAERKQAEETLRESEEKLNSFINSAPDAFALFDSELFLVRFNASAAELFGLSTQDIGKNMLEILPGIEETGRYAKYLEVLKTGKPFSIVDLVPHPRFGDMHLNVKAFKVGEIFGVIVTDITERKRAEKVLRKSQQEFAGVFMNSPVAMVYLDEKGNIVNINSRFTELFGYTLEEIKGRNIDDGMIHPPDKMGEAKELTNRGFKENFYCETIRKKKDGTFFPVSMSVSDVKIDGQRKEIIAAYIDITERKQAEKVLKENEEKFHDLFENSNDLVQMVAPDACFINVNCTWRETLGYGQKEIAHLSLFDIIHPDNHEHCKKIFQQVMSGEEVKNVEAIFITKDGRNINVEGSASCRFVDGKPVYTRGIFRDITERKKMEKELQRLAHFDILTGCCNRGYGMGLLEQQIKTAKRKKTPVLLLYLDIDNFKHINDAFGHKEGDMVLKETVKLFKSTLREVDIICRIGGDEFLLIFPDNSLNDAPLIRERLSKNLEKLNQKLAKPYKIDFSIGLSYYNPANPQPVEKLIHLADQRMYEDKNKKDEKYRKE